jgi:hypothetical protein
LRKYLVALLALGAFAVPASAMADDPPVVPTPPEFAPPTPAPVTDVASAQNAAEDYASDNARRFLRIGRSFVRVTDANAACLLSPVVDTRFGCVFTLKVLVITQRRHGWDNWGHGDSRSHSRSVRHGKRDHQRPRFRVRRYGCLGGLTLDAGPPVNVQLKFVECSRVHGGRDDITVEEPTPVAPV